MSYFTSSQFYAMIKLPQYFMNQFDKKDLYTIKNWWTQLTQEQQQEVTQMYQDENTFKAQSGFISLEKYTPYLEEINSKRKEWLNNDVWLQGFTEYLSNQGTYFTGYIPMRRIIRSEYQYLGNSDKKPETLVSGHFTYWLEDICHLKQVERYLRLWGKD